MSQTNDGENNMNNGDQIDYREDDEDNMNHQQYQDSEQQDDGDPEWNFRNQDRTVLSEGALQNNPRGYGNLQPPPSRVSTRAAHQTQKINMQKQLLHLQSPYAVPPNTLGVNNSQSKNKRTSQNNSSNQIRGPGFKVETPERAMSRNENCGIKGQDSLKRETNSRGNNSSQTQGENASRLEKFIQQKQVQNWPAQFILSHYHGDQSNMNYQQQEAYMIDARRGGTAPEGTNRNMLNASNINMKKNPYGLISGQQTDEIMALMNQNPNTQNSMIMISGNQSDKSGSNGGGNMMQGQSIPTSSELSHRVRTNTNGNNNQSNTNNQNKMIAKIYGKSNKFVMNTPGSGQHGGTGVGDQYKKPKIYHMKDLIRPSKSKTNQKANLNNSVTNENTMTKFNTRKLKISEQKDNVQKFVGQSNPVSDGGTHERKKSDSKPIGQGVQITSNIIQQNKTPQHQKTQSKVINQASENSYLNIYTPPGKTQDKGAKINLLDRTNKSQGNKIQSSINRKSYQKSNKNDTVSQGLNQYNDRKQSSSPNESRNNGLIDNLEELVEDEPQHRSQIRPRMETPQLLNYGLNDQSDNGDVNDLEDQDPKNISNNQSNDVAVNKGTNKKQTVTFKKVISQNISQMQSDEQNQQEGKSEQIDPLPENFEDRHVLYANENNVQFSSNVSINGSQQNIGSQNQQLNHKRSNKISNQNILNDSQVDDNLEQNLDQSQLQTSQGPRILKYKAVSHITDNNIRGNQIADQYIEEEDEFDQDQAHQEVEHETHNIVTQQYQAPPQTAPSSQMQKIQKSNKIAKIKGKLSSQFQVTIPDKLDYTIQPNDEQSRNQMNFELEEIDKSGIEGQPQDQGFVSGENNSSFLKDLPGDECSGPNQHILKQQQQQFSRTLDVSKNPNQIDGKRAEMKKQIQQTQKPNNSSHRFHQVSNYVNQQVQPSNIRPMPLEKRGKKNIIEINTEGQQQNNSTVPPQGIIVGPNPHGPQLGYQFEQWQRPPSRQKEPNQALGLDDTRPKTRGGGGNSLGGTMAISTHHHTQFYGINNSMFNTGQQSNTHMSGRERKRNIQQFIPQSKNGINGVLSVSNMYQAIPQEAQQNTQNARGKIQNRQEYIQNGRGQVVNNAQNGKRSRIHDFFDKRNNTGNANNGFNSTGDQSQYFQTQYQHQKKQQQFFQKNFEDLQEFQPQNQNQFPIQSMTAAHSVISGNTNQNPRRGGQPSGGNVVYQYGTSQMRPPSRHKDPPFNLGLELGPGITPDKYFDISNSQGGQNMILDGYTPGTTPNMASYCPSNRGGNNDLDDNSDIDGVAPGIDSDDGGNMQNLDIDLDNAGYFFGHGKTPGVGNQKQFKEDEEGFFENLYSQNVDNQQQNDQVMDDSSENLHQQNHSQYKAYQNANDMKVEQIQIGRSKNQKKNGIRGQSNDNKSGVKSYHPRGGAGSYGGHGGNQSIGGSNFFNQNYNMNPQQQFSQNYGHQRGHGMNQMPGQMVQNNSSSIGYQYHPALQQTQNIYIGMNQIMPQQNNNIHPQALANELFNMSNNVQNMVQSQVQAQNKGKRTTHTSGGQNHQSAAFHSQGFDQPEGNSVESGYLLNYANFNNQANMSTNQDLHQRGFVNQRSPVNDRSGAEQYLIMQNPLLKQVNKPKSATGHRISGNKNRFKNLNNSGRFVGQNSTIIHQAYNNSNMQQLKVNQKPIAGGWMEQSHPNITNAGVNNSGLQNSSKKSHNKTMQQSLSNNNKNSKISKSQINKFMIKPGTSTGNSGENSKNQIRMQMVLTEPNQVFQIGNSNFELMSSDNTAQERIKIGQEINHNRPKESKGQRSTEKRHINNQSLGVSSTSAAVGIHPIPSHTSHIKRTALNVQSPLAGTSTGGISKTGQIRSVKQNMAELFSQTSKFTRGAIRGTLTSESLNQKSISLPNDKIVVSTAIGPVVQGLIVGDITSPTVEQESKALPNNQTSFKSQTLQFPQSISSELDNDFINLFAN